MCKSFIFAGGCGWGPSSKDNMCDSWQWLPRMITEITITGPRKKRTAAVAERVNKWQSKLWRDCQNKCEAIYEIFMKCDMADNKYIHIHIGEGEGDSTPHQIWSKQAPTGADKWRKPKTNPDIRISPAESLIKMRIKRGRGRADVITWPRWLMAVFRLPIWPCVICQQGS